MKMANWQFLKRTRVLLDALRPALPEHAQRILAMQRNIVMPAKAVVLGVVFYYLFYSRWPEVVAGTNRGVVLETIQNLFGPYILLNAGAAATMFVVRRFPLGLVQWLVFTLGLLDGFLVGALAVLTNGFESVLFWVFAGLIVVNALSIPLATPQIALNLLLSGFFLWAGIFDLSLAETDISLPQLPPPKGLAARPVPTAPRPIRIIAAPPEAGPLSPTEPVLLRLTILWLLTVCCYGVQVLLERQHLAQEEAQEFSVREGQLRSAGRLAAEIAHQIKNPLAIINNAAFSLQRALTEGKKDGAKQIQIIQEEVERSDRILTQLMGYAQLSEGRVEKLSVTEELDRAIGQVLPPAAHYEVNIHRDYAPHFPPLLMQRRHLSEVLVNLLQNAREATSDQGNVSVSAVCHGDHSIELTISDDGPGISPEKLEQVFEAYYTSKEKGTGLGLAIVKNNVELYGGSVRAESELGKGARFIVVFPEKSLMKPAK